MEGTSPRLLEVDTLHKSFGGVKALNDCTFSVEAGMPVGLIGPNGAGKSTAISIIAGFQRADSGRVVFDGVDVSEGPAFKVARRGLVRTFQDATEWRRLTVMENLLCAGGSLAHEGVLRALAGRWRMRQDEAELCARAREVLKRFDLWDLRDEYAGNLSGGQKRLLELARVVMVRPKVALLDEPLAGVNPVMAKRLITLILELGEEGITFLVVEHNLRFVEELCAVVVVMANGAVIAQAAMSELRRDRSVVDAYLGGVYV